VLEDGTRRLVSSALNIRFSGRYDVNQQLYQPKTRSAEPSMTLDLLELGLCESSSLRLKYFVELFIKYTNTLPIPKVAISHKVAQNKRMIPGFLFKFVIQ